MVLRGGAPGEWLESGRGRGCWALERALGAGGCPVGGLSGVQEGQPAVAVELEEVVDGALESPLLAGGLFAA
jgi:hypothetical protein